MGDVGRIRIYRSNRQKLVGDIYLADGQLDLDILDEGLREWLQALLDKVGEVTWRGLRPARVGGPNTEPNLERFNGSGSSALTSSSPWATKWTSGPATRARAGTRYAKPSHQRRATVQPRRRAACSTLRPCVRDPAGAGR